MKYLCLKPPAMTAEVEADNPQDAAVRAAAQRGEQGKWFVYPLAGPCQAVDVVARPNYEIASASAGTAQLDTPAPPPWAQPEDPQ